MSMYCVRNADGKYIAYGRDWLYWTRDMEDAMMEKDELNFNFLNDPYDRLSDGMMEHFRKENIGVYYEIIKIYKVT